MQKLIFTVNNIWYHDEVKKMYLSLVESMPESVKQIITAKSGHFHTECAIYLISDMFKNSYFTSVHFNLHTTVL